MCDLTGKHVLVVEDEFLIALEAAAAVEQLGGMVVGPAYTLAQAIRLIETSPIDAAVLDVNLGPVSSDDAARLLETKGVPIVFTTGYGHAPAVRQATIVSKPYTPEQVAAAFDRICTA